MNFLKVFMLLLMCLLLCACSLQTNQTNTSVDHSNYTVVGFSQVGAQSDWRNANTHSMESALSEQNGYRLILDDAQQKQEKQITAIRNFIQQQVDYIVLAPTTETGWDTVLSEARAANIPVIVVDRMIEVSDPSLYTCWVGSDFLHEGDIAVQWMQEQYSGQSLRILHLQGSIGSSAQLGRTQALDRALSMHPEWQLISRESGDWTEAKGQELTERQLASGIDFNIIYSQNDNMAYGAINALKAAGLSPGKDVIILSFDACHDGMLLTLSGEISLDVECNPLHGPRVKDIIDKLNMGESPAKLTYVEEASFSHDTLTELIVQNRPY